MTKKKLFMGETADERSLLEKLTVAYAPMDDLVMQSARELAAKDAEEPDTSLRKYGLGVKFAVKHLGSI